MIGIRKIGINTHIFGMGGGGPSYSAEYQAVYDSMTTKPSGAIATAQNTMVSTLVDAGAWDVFDVFQWYESYAAEDFGINWKNPGSNTAIRVGSPGPVFTPLGGVTPDGTQSYINTKWNPVAHGVNYTQNSCSWGLLSNSNIAEAEEDFGAWGGAGTGWIYALLRYPSLNRFYAGTNDGGGTDYSSTHTNSEGLYIANRTGASANKYYRDAVLEYDANKTTVTIPNLEIYIGAYNSVGSPIFGSTKQYGCFFAGGALTVDQITTITSAIATYKETVNTLNFEFTSTGDGSGLGVFNLMVSENTTMTISGGYFYDDLNGTVNERTSDDLTTGSLNQVYIKVPSGTATVTVKNVVTQWGEPVAGGSQLNDGWNTAVTDVNGLNCPSVSVDVSLLTHCSSINVFGLNTIYGDLTYNSLMTYMEIADGTPNHTTPGSGGAICYGDISGMSLLEVLDVWDETAFTGTVSVTNHPAMECIWVNGYNSFSIDVTNMDSLRTLIVLDECNIAPSGDVSTCDTLSYLYIYGNTMTGSLAAVTDLYSITVLESTSMTLPNVTGMTALTNLLANIVFSSANVNQILADVWANRDAAKTGDTRRLDLTREATSGPPTGQGITDKANLEAYRSPNDDPAYPLWTIYTNE